MLLGYALRFIIIVIYRIIMCKQSHSICFYVCKDDNIFSLTCAQISIHTHPQIHPNNIYLLRITARMIILMTTTYIETTLSYWDALNPVNYYYLLRSSYKKVVLWRHYRLLIHGLFNQCIEINKLK